MTTLRQWLTKHGFDFDNPNAWIVYQPVTEDAYSPGWAYGDDLLPIEQIDSTHPILDHEFDDGHGAPYAPRICAGDGERAYIIVQYDGATDMVSVPVTLAAALADKATPYPGG